MSYQTFKFIHLTGVLMVFLSFGVLIARAVLKDEGKSLRKLGGLTNAVGLLMVLIAGFGLIAKLRIGFQGWVVGKIIIWFILGGLIAVINRKPEKGIQLWWLILCLGAAAAFLAIFKPF